MARGSEMLRQIPDRLFGLPYALGRVRGGVINPLDYIQLNSGLVMLQAADVLERFPYQASQESIEEKRKIASGDIRSVLLRTGVAHFDGLNSRSTRSLRKIFIKD